MNIYLIRHTRPAIEKGICYGQTDLDVTGSFQDEASVIKQLLPRDIRKVYSSPLRRCRLLAEYLFEQPIHFFDDLKELDCGSWEMQPWDGIPKAELQTWMNDIVQERLPGGESYTDLYARTVNRYESISGSVKPAAIVAHGGVLRSILSHITNTSIKDAFDRFRFHYGAVVKIDTLSGEFEILSNIETEGEQHRPVDWVR